MRCRIKYKFCPVTSTKIVIWCGVMAVPKWILGDNVETAMTDCCPCRQWNEEGHRVRLTKRGSDCGAPIGPYFGTGVCLVGISEERTRLLFAWITKPESGDEMSARRIAQFREICHLKKQPAVVEKAKLCRT